MAIIAVEYFYNMSKTDVLAENRPAHRAFLRSLFDEGTLLASGPLGSSGALIVLKADTPEAALAILDADPLAAASIDVVETRVARVWNPNIGPWQ